MDNKEARSILISLLKSNLFKIIFVIIGLVVFVKEVNVLIHTDFLNLPLNSEFIFFYLKCLFYYLALPVFFICETLEFFDVLGEDINYFYIHAFYNVVYFFLTCYGLFFLINRFF